MNEELTRYTKTIGHFFLDEDIRTVDGMYIPRWNIVLAALADLNESNLLLIGEPGHGKTTLARLMSCLTSELPIDFIDHAMIKGHPDQTWEGMIARPDYGQLNTGVEKVIWSSSMYPRRMIIDEFNRLPAGKQALFLNALQTGRFDYLNDTFMNEGALYATANHQDDGNGIIIPPILDRFALALELGWQGGSQSFSNVALREQRIALLKNNDLTEMITKNIQATDRSKEQIKVGIRQASDQYRKQLTKVFRDHNLYRPGDSDAQRWKEDITKIEFTSDAQIFLVLNRSTLSPHF